MNALVEIFKALSDETRLRIVKLLGGGELCVCHIVAALGLAQPKVSFHLRILKEAGLIQDRKQGKWTYYRIDDADMFRRFLALAVFEKLPQEKVKEDLLRLAEFRKGTGRCGPEEGKSRASKRGALQDEVWPS